MRPADAFVMDHLQTERLNIVFLTRTEACAELVLERLKSEVLGSLGIEFGDSKHGLGGFHNMDIVRDALEKPVSIVVAVILLVGAWEAVVVGFGVPEFILRHRGGRNRGLQ